MAVGLPWTLVMPPGAFRLILAFAVVMSHVSRFDIGRLAVILFFFLSGYWTARIWREKFEGQRLWSFYLSRYWRVAPLFFIVTLGAAAIRSLPLHLVNFTLLGVGSSNFDPTGVSWSLDVELQFYFLLPLIYGLITAAPKRVLLATLILAVAGWWLDTRFGITTVAKYLPAFALGAVTLVTDWKPSARAAHVSLAMFVLFTGLTAATPFLTKLDVDPFDNDIWGFLWMLPLLPYVAHSLTLRSSRLDRHLGNLSFPLYLVHFTTVGVVLNWLGANLEAKALAVALSCLVALAIYWLLDRPIDRMRVAVTEPATPRQTRTSAGA